MNDSLPGQRNFFELPEDDQRRIILKAAQEANEEQRRIMEVAKSQTIEEVLQGYADRSFWEDQGTPGSEPVGISLDEAKQAIRDGILAEVIGEDECSHSQFVIAADKKVAMVKVFRDGLREDQRWRLDVWLGLEAK